MPSGYMRRMAINAFPIMGNMQELKTVYVLKKRFPDKFKS
jgi:hypothetical protein